MEILHSLTRQFYFKHVNPVFCDLHRTIFDEKKLLEFAQLGCYLEYDLFGTEFILYQMNPDIDMPSDNERILRYTMRCYYVYRNWNKLETTFHFNHDA